MDISLHTLNQPFAKLLCSSNRVKRLVLLYSVLLLTCSYCHWKQTPPEDILIFAIGEAPKSLDPRTATDATGQRINELIFSSIIKLDENLNLTGDLATHWSIKDLTYTFFLKPNVKFHNNQLLGKEDIIFSFKEFQKESSLFATPLKVISNIEVNYQSSTGGTLKIELSQFSETFLLNLRMVKILPKKLIQESPNFFRDQPIGTGVFQFDNINSQIISLKKHTNYFGEKSLMDKVHFKIIKDANTRFLKMYKGEIDVIQSDIPFSKIPYFSKDSRFQVYSKEGLTTTYLLLNNRQVFLKNKPFRTALAQAINRNEIIKNAFEGFASPAETLTPLSIKDPKKITTLKESRILQKKDFEEIFRGKKITLKTSNNFQALENGQMIASQLEKRGLEVELKSYEWGTFYGDVKAGRFELAIMKWVGVLAYDIYRNSLHSREFPPGRNRGYFQNKEFDSIVDQAFSESKTDKRVKLYQQAEQIIFNEKPVIPLWHEKQVAIVNKRVKNYTLPSDGGFSSITKVLKRHE